MASNTLGVNVFTAPGKPMVGERPRGFGEPVYGELLILAECTVEVQTCEAFAHG